MVVSKEMKMKSYLLLSHAAVANFKHIEIIPSTWKAAINIRNDSVDDGENRAMSARSNTSWVSRIIAGAQIVWSSKRIVNVPKNAPGVTNRRSPLYCFDASVSTIGRC